MGGPWSWQLKRPVRVILRSTAIRLNFHGEWDISMISHSNCLKSSCFRGCDLPILSHYIPLSTTCLSHSITIWVRKKTKISQRNHPRIPKHPMFPKQSPNLDISISRRKPPWPPGWRLWAAALGHGSRPCGCWRRLWRRFYGISMGITWDIIGIYRINFVILVGGLEYVD